MAVMFDGKAHAQMEEEIVRARVRELKSQYGISPHLVTILVGDDRASKIYTKLKKEAAERVGIAFTIRIFETDATTKEIKDFIKEKNKDKDVHGIMVQMPLPKSLDANEIIKAISSDKDVDGLGFNSPFIHPTVKAIYEVVEVAADKNSRIVVVGARGMVGFKALKFLQDKGYKVTGVDVETKNISEVVSTADLIISATGKAGVIAKNMIKEGVSIIDVGSPKPEVGEGVDKKAKLVTPVPGGIGPMTISELLKNVILASEQKIELSES